MNNIVVYTAIFGDRDLLPDPFKFKGVTYICFTDNPTIMSDIWNMIYVVPTDEHPRRQAKIYKICPHLYFPEYTYSLWVDATHVPKIHPAQMIEKFLKDEDLALFIHKKRTCIYEEALECINLGLDDTQIIENQVTKYKNAGYPEKNGLATCTIILRKHNESKVINAMEKWLAEVQNHSMRDQISFNFVMHAENLSYYTIDQDVYKTPLFKRHHHINTPEFYLERRQKYSNDNITMRNKNPNWASKKKNYLERFLNRKVRRTYAAADRLIGFTGIYIKALSPKLYDFIKLKFLKK